jgi:hypothetical protein
VQHVTVTPTVVHVWLDTAGRIVRTAVRVDVTIASSATTSGIRPGPDHSVSTTTDTLSNFGEPVHLHAPTNPG